MDVWVGFVRVQRQRIAMLERLQRMAVFLQQAVSVAPAAANTIGLAISAKFDRGA
jgi:integral membrane sensor domain MASE1